METIIPVDKAGRVVLPKEARRKLGLEGEGVLTLELKESEVVLRRSKAEKSPSKAISKMNLPSGRWSRVEREILEGATV